MTRATILYPAAAVSARLQINLAAAPYRHAYRWWRREARASANPRACIHYALNQLKLARAMDADPQFFSAKPSHQTDWERFFGGAQ